MSWQKFRVPFLILIFTGVVFLEIKLLLSPPVKSRYQENKEKKAEEEKQQQLLENQNKN